MLWWTTALRLARAGSSADWAMFVGLNAIILTLLLALARLSQSAVRDDVDPPGRLATVSSEDPAPPAESRIGPTRSESVATPDPEERPSERTDAPDRSSRNPDQPPMGIDRTHRSPDATVDPVRPPGAFDRLDERTGRPDSVADGVTATDDVSEMSTGALLVNVALTQGLFGGLLLAAAWYTKIPAWAFGLRATPLSTGLPALGVGIALGVSLYVANELGAASADAMGVEYDERLRSMLAPDSAFGWLLLLALVLPIIAGVEEFVFRAAVIGVTTAGFGTSPWALAVVSSLAFALGHGAQGRLGIVVTGGLGFVLASAFILTGSFVAVVVAHYLVNALEFVVHELLGVDWAGSS